MPFGMSLAPYVWTKAMLPLVQFLRELNFRMISYVDDFGGTLSARPGPPATRADATRGYALVHLVIGALCLWLHPLEGSYSGATVVQLLGHVSDTAHGVYRLPLDRAERFVLLSRCMLHFYSSRQRWVRFAPLRAFCGTAVSTTLSVVPARFHLRSLFTSLFCRHPLNGDCGLGNRVVVDLHWWVGLAATGVTLAWPI